MAADEEDNLSQAGDERLGTGLLSERPGADAQDLESIVRLAYDELRVIARHHLRAEREGHTLDTTSMVHEAFIRLAAAGGPQWHDSKHFYASASKIMRHILVDHARQRNADKRGGGVRPLTLDRVDGAEPDDTIDIIALDEAIRELSNLDPRLERIVECRYFAGMSIPDTAQALETSVRTVERDWTRAKAYILRALERSGRR